MKNETKKSAKQIKSDKKAAGQLPSQTAPAMGELFKGGGKVVAAASGVSLVADANTGGSMSAANVVVQTKVEAAQAAAIVTLGMAVIEAHGKVGEKYWALITFIHTNKVPRKAVVYELEKLGFKKARISEINRVANSEKAYTAYEGKLIGFDKALKLARVDTKGADPVLTPAARQLTAGDVLSEDDAEAVIEHEKHSVGEGSPAKPTVGQLLKIIIGRLFAIIKKPLKMSSPDGAWVLEIRQGKLTKEAQRIEDNRAAAADAKLKAEAHTKAMQAGAAGK